MLNLHETLMDELDDKELKLLCIVATYMNEKGECWPKRSTLLSRLKWGARTFHKVRDRLVEKNMLEVRRRDTNSDGPRSSIYCITTRKMGRYQGGQKSALTTQPELKKCPDDTAIVPSEHNQKCPDDTTKSALTTQRSIEQEVLSNEPPLLQQRGGGGEGGAVLVLEGDEVRTNETRPGGADKKKKGSAQKRKRREQTTWQDGPYSGPAGAARLEADLIDFDPSYTGIDGAFYVAEMRRWALKAKHDELDWRDIALGFIHNQARTKAGVKFKSNGSQQKIGSAHPRTESRAERNARILAQVVNEHESGNRRR